MSPSQEMCLESLQQELNNVLNEKVTLLMITNFYQKFCNIFQSCVKLSKPQTLQLANCCIVFLKYIQRCVEFTKLEPKQIQAIQHFTGIIDIIPKLEGSRDEFIRLIISPVFKRVTSLKTELWLTKAILENFNRAVQQCNDELRNQLADKNVTYLNQSMNILGTCGDYNYQMILMETVFRICSQDQINTFACFFFPESEILQKALREVKRIHFDKDLRIFLNIVNNKFGKVFSIKCAYVFLGGIQVRPPKVSDGGLPLWVDFNYGTKTITILCNKNSLKMSSDVQSPEVNENEWETITINMKSVIKVYNSKLLSENFSLAQGSIVLFRLVPPCGVLYPSSFKAAEAAQLKLAIIDCPELQQLETYVLPRLFDENFQKLAIFQKQERDLQGQPKFLKRVYKPLTTKITMPCAKRYTNGTPSSSVSDAMSLKSRILDFEKKTFKRQKPLLSVCQSPRIRDVDELREAAIEMEKEINIRKKMAEQGITETEAQADELYCEQDMTVGNTPTEQRERGVPKFSTAFRCKKNDKRNSQISKTPIKIAGQQQHNFYDKNVGSGECTEKTKNKDDPQKPINSLETIEQTNSEEVIIMKDKTEFNLNENLNVKQNNKMNRPKKKEIIKVKWPLGRFHTSKIFQDNSATVTEEKTPKSKKQHKHKNIKDLKKEVKGPLKSQSSDIQLSNDLDLENRKIVHSSETQLLNSQIENEEQNLKSVSTTLESQLQVNQVFKDVDDISAQKDLLKYSMAISKSQKRTEPLKNKKPIQKPPQSLKIQEKVSKLSEDKIVESEWNENKIIEKTSEILEDIKAKPQRNKKNVKKQPIKKLELSKTTELAQIVESEWNENKIIEKTSETLEDINAKPRKNEKKVRKQPMKKLELLTTAELEQFELNESNTQENTKAVIPQIKSKGYKQKNRDSVTRQKQENNNVANNKIESSISENNTNNGNEELLNSQPEVSEVLSTDYVAPTIVTNRNVNILSSHKDLETNTNSNELLKLLKEKANEEGQLNLDSEVTLEEKTCNQRIIEVANEEIGVTNLSDVTHLTQSSQKSPQVFNAKPSESNLQQKDSEDLFEFEESFNDELLNGIEDFETIKIDATTSKEHSLYNYQDKEVIFDVSTTTKKQLGGEISTEKIPTQEEVNGIEDSLGECNDQYNDIIVDTLGAAEKQLQGKISIGKVSVPVEDPKAPGDSSQNLENSANVLCHEIKEAAEVHSLYDYQDKEVIFGASATTKQQLGGEISMEKILTQEEVNGIEDTLGECNDQYNDIIVDTLSAAEKQLQGRMSIVNVSIPVEEDPKVPGDSSQNLENSANEIKEAAEVQGNIKDSSPNLESNVGQHHMLESDEVHKDHSIKNVCDDLPHLKEVAKPDQEMRVVNNNSANLNNNECSQDARSIFKLSENKENIPNTLLVVNEPNKDTEQENAIEEVKTSEKKGLRSKMKTKSASKGLKNMSNKRCTIQTRNVLNKELLDNLQSTSGSKEDVQKAEVQSAGTRQRSEEVKFSAEKVRENLDKSLSPSKIIKKGRSSRKNQKQKSFDADELLNKNYSSNNKSLLQDDLKADNAKKEKEIKIRSDNVCANLNKPSRKRNILKKAKNAQKILKDKSNVILQDSKNGEYPFSAEEKLLEINKNSDKTNNATNNKNNEKSADELFSELIQTFDNFQRTQKTNETPLSTTTAGQSCSVYNQETVAPDNSSEFNLKQNSHVIDDLPSEVPSKKRKILESSLGGPTSKNLKQNSGASMGSNKDTSVLKYGQQKSKKSSTRKLYNPNAIIIVQDIIITKATMFDDKNKVINTNSPSKIQPSEDIEHLSLINDDHPSQLEQQEVTVEDKNVVDNYDAKKESFNQTESQQSSMNETPVMLPKNKSNNFVKKSKPKQTEPQRSSMDETPVVLPENKSNNFVNKSKPKQTEPQQSSMDETPVMLPENKSNNFVKKSKPKQTEPLQSSMDETPVMLPENKSNNFVNKSKPKQTEPQQSSMDEAPVMLPENKSSNFVSKSKPKQTEPQQSSMDEAPVMLPENKSSNFVDKSKPKRVFQEIAYVDVSVDNNQTERNTSIDDLENCMFEPLKRDIQKNRRLLKEIKKQSDKKTYGDVCNSRKQSKAGQVFKKLKKTDECLISHQPLSRRSHDIVLKNTQFELCLSSICETIEKYSPSYTSGKKCTSKSRQSKSSADKYNSLNSCSANNKYAKKNNENNKNKLSGRYLKLRINKPKSQKLFDGLKSSPLRDSCLQKVINKPVKNRLTGSNEILSPKAGVSNKRHYPKTIEEEMSDTSAAGRNTKKHKPQVEDFTPQDKNDYNETIRKTINNLSALEDFQTNTEVESGTKINISDDYYPVSPQEQSSSRMSNELIQSWVRSGAETAAIKVLKRFVDLTLQQNNETNTMFLQILSLIENDTKEGLERTNVLNEVNKILETYLKK